MTSGIEPDLRNGVATGRRILENILEAAVNRLTGRDVAPPAPAAKNLKSLVGPMPAETPAERLAILKALGLGASRDISKVPALGTSAAAAAVASALPLRAATVDRYSFWRATLAATQVGARGHSASARVAAWLRASYLTPNTRLVPDILRLEVLSALLCTELTARPWQSHAGSSELHELLEQYKPATPPDFVVQLVLCCHAKLALYAGARFDHLTHVPLAAHRAFGLTTTSAELPEIPDCFAPYFNAMEETA